jgi:hypothetical protein
MVDSDGLVAEFRPRLGRRSPQEEVFRTPELLGLIYSKLIPNRENRLLYCPSNGKAVILNCLNRLARKAPNLRKMTTGIGHFLPSEILSSLKE